MLALLVTSLCARNAAGEAAEQGARVPNYYVDGTGSRKNADTEYARLLAAGEPHPVRAFAEMALVLGAGTLWYWVDDRNVLDWDNPSIRQRLSGEAWVFDNNGFVMNFLAHPMSGAAFYALPRANNLGVASSALYCFTTSMVWEYVIEFKEKVSINDVLVTPGAGIAFGEFFHKLAWYLNRTPRPATPAQSAAQWVLGTTVRLHRTLDAESTERGTTSDALGFSDDIWRRFEVGYSAGAARALDHSSVALHTLDLDGRLVSMPGYLRPGRIGRFFQDADFSELRASLTASEHGPGVELDGDTVLLGYFSQQLGGSFRRPYGTAVTLGTSLGYRYLRSPSRGLNERIATLHLPGAALDWQLLQGDLAARFSARAHVDFAGIGSLAHKQWRATNPDLRQKSILRRHGYYYGWGGSARLSGELELGPVRLGGGLRFGSYDSHEGRDRTQDRVNADIDLTDELVEYDAQAEVAAGSGFHFGASFRWRRWTSRAGAADARAITESLSAGVRYAF